MIEKTIFAGFAVMGEEGYVVNSPMSPKMSPKMSPMMSPLMSPPMSQMMSQKMSPKMSQMMSPLMSPMMSPSMSPSSFMGFKFLKPPLIVAVMHTAVQAIITYSPPNAQQITSCPQEYGCLMVSSPNPSIFHAWIIRRKLRTANPPVARVRKNLLASPQVM